MKKVIRFLAGLLIVLSLCSCGSTEKMPAGISDDITVDELSNILLLQNAANLVEVQNFLVDSMVYLQEAGFTVNEIATNPWSISDEGVYSVLYTAKDGTVHYLWYDGELHIVDMSEGE